MENILTRRVECVNFFPCVDSVALRREYVLDKFPNGVKYNFDRDRNDDFKYLRNKDGLNLTFSRKYGKYFYSVEASIPKLLNGHNVSPVADEDIGRALDLITDYATFYGGIEFDAKTAPVARVDYACNFQTGTKLNQYMMAARRSEYNGILPVTNNSGRTPYFNIRTKNEYTVEESFCFYNKYKETLFRFNLGKVDYDTLLKSTGLLRAEHRFMDPDTIKLKLLDRYKLSNRQAQTLLRENVARRVITEDIRIMNFDRPILSRDARKAKIQAYHGKTSLASRRLCDFIDKCDALGLKQAKQYYSERTFYRYKQELQQVGVTISGITTRTLPRLKLTKQVHGNLVNDFTVEKPVENGECMNSILYFLTANFDISKNSILEISL